MARFVRRMLGAAALHADTYEEVEHDRRATPEACAVVTLSAVAAGIGAWDVLGWQGIGWSALHALLLWISWAFVTWLIGTRWLPGPDTSADPGELLRTIGFSSAPGILRIFALTPVVGGWIFLLSTLWMLVAMVVAVRQALDYAGTLRALAVCAIGFPVYAVGLLTSLLLLGPWPL